MILDVKLKEAVSISKNLMVPWYLMASYAYYELDTPFLSDGAFDQLAKDLLSAWDGVVHRHKHLITI